MEQLVFNPDMKPVFSSHEYHMFRKKSPSERVKQLKEMGVIRNYIPTSTKRRRSRVKGSSVKIKYSIVNIPERFHATKI